MRMFQKNHFGLGYSQPLLWNLTFTKDFHYSRVKSTLSFYGRQENCFLPDNLLSSLLNHGVISSLILKKETRTAFTGRRGGSYIRWERKKHFVLGQVKTCRHCALETNTSCGMLDQWRLRFSHTASPGSPKRGHYEHAVLDSTITMTIDAVPYQKLSSVLFETIPTKSGITPNGVFRRMIQIFRKIPLRMTF